MRRVTWPVGRGWVNIARAFDPPRGGRPVPCCIITLHSQNSIYVHPATTADAATEYKSASVFHCLAFVSN